MLHIVIVGDIVDGFKFYGHFKNAEAAADFGAEHFEGSTWWIAPLDHPDSVKEN